MGLDPTRIATQIHYIRPETPFNIQALEHILTLIDTHNPLIVSIDSLGEAFALSGINENHDNEVGPWLRNYMRPIADAGPAIILIDHATKTSDNPLYASGSKRKRAAITGASYQLQATKPFVRGAGGRLLFRCAKDRHGHYRLGEVAAELVMESHTNGNVNLTLEPPTTPEATADNVANAIVNKVVAALDYENQRISQTALLEITKSHGKVKARNATILAAIELARVRDLIGYEKHGQSYTHWPLPE